MTERTSSESSYTMGYSEEFRQLLDRRSAETHARAFAPTPQAPASEVSTSVVDRGTITVGLAKGGGDR